MKHIPFFKILNLDKYYAQIYMIVLVVFSLLSIIAILQVYTGIADNSDYTRSIAQFFLHSKFNHIHFKAWNNLWILNPNLSFFHLFPKKIFPSSYQFILAIQVLFNKLFYAKDVYSVVFASLITRGLWYLIFFIFLYEVHKSIQGIVFIIFSIFLWLLFNDTAFVQFFNSFYQGQAGLIFLGFFIILLIKLPKNRLSGWYLLLFTAFLILLSFAKTQYMFSPLVASITFALTAWIFKKKPLRGNYITLTVICLLISLITFFFQSYLNKDKTMSYFGKPNISLKQYDAYEAYYTGVLTLLPKSKITQDYPQVNVSCVGKWTFDESASGKKCIYDTAATYKNVLLVYLHNPLLIFKAFNKVRSEMGQVRMDYLSKHQKDQTNFADLKIFNIWNSKISHFVRNLYYPLLILMFGSIWYLKDFWNENPNWLNLKIFLIIFSISQYGISLADGFHEVPKHIFLGVFALLLAFLIFVTSIAQSIQNYWEQRLSFKT